MKILQVYMGYYQVDKGGGISVYVRNIAERLAKKHEVTVFATNPGGLPRCEVQNGVRVERFSRFAPSTAYFFSLGMLLRLRKAKFDVVHAHGYQAFPFHFSSLADSKKFIASAHYHSLGDSPFRNSLLRLLKPIGGRTLRIADKIVAVSEFEKSLLADQFKLDPRRIVVIPCGTNTREFLSLKPQKRSFQSILFVGRLENYKGAQYLVEAMPLLRNDCVLDIVGTGPMRPVLERRARELGIMDRVVFHQEMPRRDLLQMYLNADVFVLLSKYEAYSMAVAEALTAGTPCIVAKASALTEWIDDKCCFGIDYPIKKEVLAELINSVLAIRNSTQKCATASKKIKGWNEVVKQLEDVYEG